MKEHICCWNDVRINGNYCTTCGKKENQDNKEVGKEQ
jgi:Zn ribbon nucleic-acid-binding protein